jgi:hypothetical protein
LLVLLRHLPPMESTMGIWEQEAQRSWKTGWIGGAGPFACVVKYHKGTSVTLFKKSNEAEAHKLRLDAIQPDKKRWRSTEIVNLTEVRAQRTAAITTGRR